MQTQNLQVEVDGIKSVEVYKKIVVYDLGLQVISLAPKLFVVGHNPLLKILLTRDEPVVCSFTSPLSEDKVVITNSV